MKELSREQCSQIAGGDPGMVLAGGGAFGGGGNSFGSGGINFGASGFDGIGPLSCRPAPSTASDGWFGLSFTETLGAVAAGTAIARGLGQGYGASLAIEAAGGFSAIGELGAAAAGLGGSAALGLGSAFALGIGVGTVAYHQSDTLQDVAQSVVGGVMLGIEGIKQVGASIFGIDRVPQQVYMP